MAADIELKVVVSQRVENHPDRNECRDALDQRLSHFLLVAGYVPVPIPNILSVCDEYMLPARIIESWLKSIVPHAVLLSGGNNIGSCQERDRTEEYLLTYARDRRLPVLGICRGMQMMGVWAGAGLKPVSGHVCSRHVLTGKIEREVNSYHNYSIDRCPDGYSVLARSDDGEIEAIQHECLPWEAWMWHPEREDEFFHDDVSRIKTLFR